MCLGFGLCNDTWHSVRNSGAPNTSSAVRFVPCKCPGKGLLSETPWRNGQALESVTETTSWMNRGTNALITPILIHLLNLCKRRKHYNINSLQFQLVGHCAIRRIVGMCSLQGQYVPLLLSKSTPLYWTGALRLFRRMKKGPWQRVGENWRLWQNPWSNRLDTSSQTSAVDICRPSWQNGRVAFVW